MLIIERNLNETICIGSNIRVTVVGVPGRNRVRLGLHVDPKIPIWRDDQHKSSEPAEVVENTLHVMVVEDDPGEAKLIREALAHARWVQIQTFEKGEALLEHLREELDLHKKAHLVLLDLNLPGMSGLDVIQAMRQDERLRLVPIVVLSGSDDEADISACLSAGANAFVTKAMDFGELCRSMLRIANFWRHTQHAP